MARRDNELFIGSEFMGEEGGREIKHIGLISHYGEQRIKKISDTPLLVEGIDLETNSETGELMLLGSYNGDYYSKTNTDFLTYLFELVLNVYWKGKTSSDHSAGALVWWNKLDPFVLYKQFLLLFKDELAQNRSLKKYGKVAGEWDRHEGKWSIRPVVEATVRRGARRFRFGIKNVIRSSVLFFFYELEGETPKRLDNGNFPLSTVWAFDVAPLYKNHLAKEMEFRRDKFPYYSKIDKSAHIVDWERYYSDAHYRKDIVELSNEYDARAVYDLANLISEDFYSAFNAYPKTLISAGSLARASVIATFYNKYESYGLVEREIWREVRKDAQAISLITYRDSWVNVIGEEAVKDMFCAFYEAYSGGYIEAFLYGLIGEGYSSDIASAYVKYISLLKDLRGAEISTGEGEPPHIPNSYCVIRGRVDIPVGVKFSPITVKHLTEQATNVRAVGEYIATYHIEERDFMEKQGAKFYDETWWNIETTGELSPYAQVAIDMTDLRYKLIEKGNSAEYLVKTSTASLYGILFEATKTYEEALDLSIKNAGYRGGEFLNALYASWITAKTRIQMSEAGIKIEEAGGKVGLAMTDCVFVAGAVSTMPSDMVKEDKTLGWFEKPEPFSNMAILGTGRYSYIKDNGKVMTKNRGLNVVDFHNKEGVDLGSHNWINALRLAEEAGEPRIRVKTRTLISVGMVANNNFIEMVHMDCNGEGCPKCDETGVYKMPLKVEDLGRIVETYRDVALLSGENKRILDPINDIKDITQGYIGTKSIYYSYGMEGLGTGFVDQTLPFYRHEVKKLSLTTLKKRDKANRVNASIKYASKKNNKDKILEQERDKYAMIRKRGFSRDKAKKWCKRSIERIKSELFKNDIGIAT